MIKENEAGMDIGVRAGMAWGGREGSTYGESMNK
jgi:hypothetical protein